MKFEIGQKVMYKEIEYEILVCYKPQQFGLLNAYKLFHRDSKLTCKIVEENKLTPVIKKWEPKKGYWTIDIDTGVYESESTENYRLAGLERETKEQAQQAYDRLRKFSRLSAWVDEFAPDAEFELIYSDLYSVGFVFQCPFPSVIEKLKENIENGVVEL